jgi:hypothetical protein
MTVLVDTSVWVDHFRQGNAELVRLIEMDQTLMHPWILGEIACGSPPARGQTLSDLGLLRLASQATLPEVMAFIEREKLFGVGCGLVDVALLASTLMTPGARLWSLDKRLAALADRFGVGYRASVH